jgi:hypothetical protein
LSTEKSLVQLKDQGDVTLEGSDTSEVFLSFGGVSQLNTEEVFLGAPSLTEFSSYPTCQVKVMWKLRLTAA